MYSFLTPRAWHTHLQIAEKLKFAAISGQTHGGHPVAFQPWKRPKHDKIKVFRHSASGDLCFVDQELSDGLGLVSIGKVWS